jgi:hypothetical protein
LQIDFIISKKIKNCTRSKDFCDLLDRDFVCPSVDKTKTSKHESEFKNEQYGTGSYAHRNIIIYKLYYICTTQFHHKCFKLFGKSLVWNSLKFLSIIDGKISTEWSNYLFKWLYFIDAFIAARNFPNVPFM